MSSIILGIETSTKICSVAISDGNKLLALKEEGGEYSHSEKLTVFIQEILKGAGLKLEEIDAVAVSKGPGSYTGLRIGVSVAKGLCYALEKPLIAVDTLQAMALGGSKTEKFDLYCPMIDARRMEVYTALYDDENKMVEMITAKIIDENSFVEVLNEKKIIFFGDGADKCEAILGSNSNAIFSEKGLPSAEYINQIAIQKFDKQEFEDVAYFEPYYLKDFVATTPKKLL
ncbi:MAG: tRNA (adenosine(37)-N6)-threonylcarbamoyltransferase complex dimerization subunit type 1 TsaB [Flavobacteriales bacterium]|nr:tRNA (adenosine(37)-N6)-threonylcarbamoyltransferase complex dimerization subunit type 1 TsaB [Flavobacteriales bacterium]NQX98135.1 tRNA (adenosine(37)-N6)-threonylcarbamoyltransferase complex dimerization subunit type 1 TsaB [Flavobacteriales bacterium]